MFLLLKLQLASYFLWLKATFYINHYLYKFPIKSQYFFLKPIKLLVKPENMIK